MVLAFGPSSRAREVVLFTTEILVEEPASVTRETGILGYLEALTFDFEREGQEVSCVLTYARPHPELEGTYQMVVAADTGFEGIACLDDTARAARLALRVYERSKSRKALSLARRWLSFVDYMQYEDGQFSNFIRNAAGVRNASGPTSVKGGLAWTARALWALATAYRLTGIDEYRQRYEAGALPIVPDNKINAITALAALELWRADPTAENRRDVIERAEAIVGDDAAPYFADSPGDPKVKLWGYQQLHAVAAAAHYLDRPGLLVSCQRTVDNLVAPDVQAKFWYGFPGRSKMGVCAYNVAPIVEGLAAMFGATGVPNYRDLALQGAEWLYGRNDAGVPLYDPRTGMCRDGVNDGIASDHYGAESSIEAGFAELVRRELADLP